MDKKILKKELSLLEAADYAATNRLHLKEDNEYYYFIEDWEEVVDGEIVDNKEKETEIARAKKLRELTEYDNSEAVNSFIYQGQNLWIKLDKRIEIKHGIESEQLKGETTTILKDEQSGLKIKLPIATALSMLVDIEVYAKKCWVVTSDHEDVIKSLKTKEEIENYNFRIGYPQKIEL